MADWSEGSVFVIVGITTANDKLLHDGLVMIDEGQTMAPVLVSLIFRKLVACDHIDSAKWADSVANDDTEQHLRELIPEWIAELEKDLQDGRTQAIEDLLDSLPIGDFN